MVDVPLVSIIVPAYNCKQYISETLASIFSQDYSNIEVIVVNDGSTDDTLNFLQTYGNKIILVDQENTGAPGARNAGIKVAKGQYIGFCDADDVWAAEKISSQVGYLNKNSKVGMVYCGWSVWDPSSDQTYVVPDGFARLVVTNEIVSAQSGSIYNKLLLDCICLTSTVLYRKSTLEQVGYFDVNLWNGDDYDFWIRTSRITEIHKLKDELVLYRILPTSVSKRATVRHYEYEVLQRALSLWGAVGPYGEAIDSRSLKNRIANMRFDFGYLHWKSGDAGIAIEAFWDCIVNKPVWFAPWAYLVLCLCKYLSSGKTKQLIHNLK